MSSDDQETKNPPKLDFMEQRGGFTLFCFLVRRVLAAPFAEFAELQTFLKQLLILVAIIARLLTDGTLEFDEIILRHI